MMDLIKERNPPWAAALYDVLTRANELTAGTLSVLDRLKVVRKAALRTVIFSYPAGDEPFSAACEAAEKVSRSLACAPACINTGTAASDLRRHIFLEAFLEKGSDTSALYEYCHELFTNNALEHLLLSSYQ